MGREIMVDPEFEEKEKIKEEIYGEEESKVLSEDTLIQRLIEAANYKEDKNQWVEIEIIRPRLIDGKEERVKLLSFRVRPLSDSEVEDAKKNAFVKKYPYADKGTKKSKEKIFNEALYQSYCIYYATVDEDRAKIWDNPQFQSKIQIYKGVEIVDAILVIGEKERTMDAINLASGFYDDEEDKVTAVDIKN